MDITCPEFCPIESATSDYGSRDTSGAEETIGTFLLTSYGSPGKFSKGLDA